MLKKITNMVITISLFFFISSTALYASEYSKHSEKNNKVPVTDYSGHLQKIDKITSEGYREIRWGMSKMFFYYILPNIKKENNDLLTIMESRFAGIESKTKFHFVHDMLFRIVILFDKKLSSAQKGSLENYLFEKYGIAELLNDGGENIEIQWERPDTLINYIHYKRTDTTIITFKSKTIDNALNALEETPLDSLNGGQVKY